MTCLTLSPDVAEEAVAGNVDLVISHHPILFRPVKRLTDATPEGGMLLSLIAAGVAVYSPHTAFDSAAAGINQQLAESLGLSGITALRPSTRQDGRDPARETSASTSAPTTLGSGRAGRLEQAVSFGDFIVRVQTALGIQQLQYVGDDRQNVSRVAVACGSAAEFLPDAQQQGCDVLVTGEARFHACLEARTAGIALILAGHYATERPAIALLATRVAQQFPGLHSFASRTEQDPIRWSNS
jgi:dinuclear metal center YbgI/SA1388 family protein